MAKIDPSLELKRLQAYRPYSSTPATQGKPVLWMAPSDWDAAAAVMRDAALIPAGLKSSDLFTNAFLPA
jgi:NitT/TauT family transport system substrate-binding protein